VGNREFLSNSGNGRVNEGLNYAARVRVANHCQDPVSGLTGDCDWRLATELGSTLSHSVSAVRTSASATVRSTACALLLTSSGSVLLYQHRLQHYCVDLLAVGYSHGHHTALNHMEAPGTLLVTLLSSSACLLCTYAYAVCL
jgi:hypothetical protein